VLVPAGQCLRFSLMAASLFDDPKLRAAERQIDAIIVPVLDAATADGTLRGDLPADFLGDLLEGMLYASWLSISKGNVTTRDATAMLLEVFMNGFGAAKAGAADATLNA
jgi:hypothetical protein